MSWLNVEKALMKSLTDLSLGFPIIQEGDSQERIDKAGASEFWLEVFNLPATTDPLDKNLADQYNGIYQVNINGKQSIGKGDILAVVDQIIANYKTGDIFTVNTCDVEINIASPGPATNDGSFFVIPISIEWFAYIAR